MKSVRIGLIVALSVMAFGLCGILVYGMAGGDVFRLGERRGYSNAQLVLEKEIPLDGIESVSILYDICNNDVYLYEGESDVIIVREYGNYEMSENELSAVKVSENCLVIKGTRRNDNGFGFSLFGFNGGYYNRHYTEVYLPASYQGELLLTTSSGNIVSEMDIRSEKDVSVTSTSGDVEFSAVMAGNVSVNTSSGDVVMENIAVNAECPVGEIRIQTTSGYLAIGTITGDAQFKTTSGDVKVQYADGDIQIVTNSGTVKIPEGSGNRKISTSSGDIMTGSTEGSFQVKSQSGDVQVTVQKGEGSIETTSGDVQLSLEELAGALNINSSSGYVDIILSDENEFEFMTSTSSGDIATFFDDDLTFSSRRNQAQGIHGVNERSNRIEIRTTSGDVRISKY